MDLDRNIENKVRRDQVQVSTIQISQRVHKRDTQSQQSDPMDLNPMYQVRELIRWMIRKVDQDLHTLCDSVNLKIQRRAFQVLETMIQALILQRKAHHPTDLDQNITSNALKDQVLVPIVQNYYLAHKKDTQFQQSDPKDHYQMYQVQELIQWNIHKDDQDLHTP